MGKFLEALYGEASLYVKQLAWLNAVPERAKGDTSTTRMTRLEGFRAQQKDYQPDMPPAEATYLLDHLLEVGPVSSSGMGAFALTFQELQSWQEQIGLCLQPWEVRMLRQLSRDYLNESHEAEKRDRPAPWTPAEISEAQRTALSKHIQESMRALMKAKP